MASSAPSSAQGALPSSVRPSSNDDSSRPGIQETPSPAPSLPKGGGAIRGMGEKFDVNPVKGTASLNIPIFTSRGRDGFGPDLALSYDSAAGNGPFGMGWSLSTDAISRKTSIGLPHYADHRQSDAFLLSGAEDLVPVLLADDSRHEDRSIDPGFVVHQYRSRLGPKTSRIERWSNISEPSDVHWRVYSADDTLKIYGLTENARIFNPDHPEQIFSWLLSECLDWKGNAMILRYKAENGQGADLTQRHERGRGTVDDKRRSANRYLKSIRYGNRVSFLTSQGRRLRFPTQNFVDSAGWSFVVLFDYGEHDLLSPTPAEQSPWTHRDDPFSSYRSGFEVRTARLCRRVLMFHNFTDPDVGQDCLINAVEFSYRSPQTANQLLGYTYLTAVQQHGYRKDNRQPTGYVKRSIPRLEMQYAEPVIDDKLQSLDPKIPSNYSEELNAAAVRWIDLYGEGAAGILTQTKGAWFYSRNLSPSSRTDTTLQGRPSFSHPETVPLPGNLQDKTRAVFADLQGNGAMSLLTQEGSFAPASDTRAPSGIGFTPFDGTLTTAIEDPTLAFIDLTGDGFADAFLTKESLWHPSLGRRGFGPPEKLVEALSERICPSHMFKNDLIGQVHFADMSGDGLADIVWVGNGEMFYFPNLGLGRFGSLVEMDNAPKFDSNHAFDPQRLVIADIDGSGTTDLIYLHAKGPRFYLNRSGNSWSEMGILESARGLSAGLDFAAVDLLGNGTTCLVISETLHGSGFGMRYINLGGSLKPHLLVEMSNNLGASTKVQYSTSTKFYQDDKERGAPWLANLAIPVHVVEKRTVQDRISGNVFTSRYAYHHGYFDCHEREFRGFGMVEQWDTDELLANVVPGQLPSNLSPAHALPATHSKSWFHLGISLDAEKLSQMYKNEYFDDSNAWLLPDTVLPLNVSTSEERDAVRSLKGSLLRREVYVDDLPPQDRTSGISPESPPLSTIESNYTIVKVQSATPTAPAVFRMTPRESFSYSYERAIEDPRIDHQCTLETNEHGQTLRQVSISYGRRQPDASLPTAWDRDQQTTTHILYSDNAVTAVIDDSTLFPDTFRLPGTYQQRQYEVTGLSPDLSPGPFTFEQLWRDNFAALDQATEISHESVADVSIPQKRLLSLFRTLFRRDNLDGLLALGEMESCAIAGQSFVFAFTEAFVDTVYRNGNELLADPAKRLTDTTGAGGGYISTTKLRTDGLFPVDDSYSGYWAASGRSFYSDTADPRGELAFARAHFYKPRRFRDVFGGESLLTFDDLDFLLIETKDSVGNVITVGERDTQGRLLRNGNDYRVLQPRIITDANDNRVAVSYDALRAVAGTATMGKLGERVGDTLEGFEPDLDEEVVLDHLREPTSSPETVMKGAGARFVYDLFAYDRTKTTPMVQPVAAYSITRTRHTHDRDLDALQFHHAISFTDGLGRMIQSKVQTKPGPVSQRDSQGRIVIGNNGQPTLTNTTVDPRWVTTGSTVYNNKGLVVAQYEPFFSEKPAFELSVEVGVASMTFYDPLGRAIAVLNPNGTYSKTLFTSWMSEAWDCNDTVAKDPRTDIDVAHVTGPLLQNDSNFKTWLQQRLALPSNDPNNEAAQRTLAHADTPVIAHFDSLGRPFLKVGQNRVSSQEHPLDGQAWKQHTRVELDIQGRAVSVRDANTENDDKLGRVIETRQHDMLGRALVYRSMDAGKRTFLLNAQNQELCVWDDRGHQIETVYDRAGRPALSSVVGDHNGPGGPDAKVIFNVNIYGERHPQAKQLNLCGTVYLSADQAGIMVNERKDFKGNLLASSRRFAREYRQTVDWTQLLDVVPPDSNGRDVFDNAELDRVLNATVQPETFRDAATFDAMNRPLTTASLSSNGAPTVVRHSYAVGNLDKVEANLRSESSDANAEPIWTTFVRGLDFDAKGQINRIELGNNVETKYEYSIITHELTRMIATRQSSRGGREKLQDLSYVYDAMSHPTSITDEALPTLYFAGQVVNATMQYTYDALYQLIHATGREHLGQDGQSPLRFPNADGFSRGALPGDSNAMGRYQEDYVYDRAGNLKTLKHAVDDPRALGHTWTRTFTHNEASRIESDKHCNRLTSTSTANASELFSYDAHGNTTRMPSLGGRTETSNMTWDYLDRLRSVDLGGGGKAFYVYEKGGRRARKVIERSPGLTQERLYLNGMTEIYREHRGVQISLERETQHISGPSGRLALVETRIKDVQGTDRAPEEIQRYQLSTNLKSTSVELDENARILTYEEYSPFGSTTYSAALPSLELSKRYRFTGKERDEETGLMYHGARYYAPWLARWINCDPGGISDGPNLYEYCSSNPVTLLDPGGTSGQPFEQWLMENAHQIPEHVKSILMGRDAELYAYQLAKDALGPGETIAREVVIGVKNKNVWKVLVRLDFITKGLVTEVKSLAIRVDEAGNLIKDEALVERIVANIANAEQKANAVQKYVQGLRFWSNPKMSTLGDPKKAQIALKLVAEGGEKALMQLQGVVEEVKAMRATAVSIDVMKGSGRGFIEAAKFVGKQANFVRPMAEKAWLAAGVVAKHGSKVAAPLAVLGAGMAIHTLVTSNDTTDKVLAGLSLVGTAMTFVPGMQLAGIALTAGVAVGQYLHERKKEEQQEPAAPGPQQDPAPAAEGPRIASNDEAQQGAASSQNGQSANQLSIGASPKVDKGVTVPSNLEFLPQQTTPENSQFTTILRVTF